MRRRVASRVTFGRYAVRDRGREGATVAISARPPIEVLYVFLTLNF